MREGHTSHCGLLVKIQKMANEATLIVQRSIPINMTVADGTGIEKGALLKLSDPFTVASHAALNDIVGGVAYNEKIANDGVTKLAVLRGPGDLLKVTASGSITVGDPCGLADAGVLNYVRSLKATLNISGCIIIGTALETAAAGETFVMELNIRTAGYAVS